MLADLDRTTQLALNAINRRFYAAIAEEFSASRRSAWPGFERIAACVRAREGDGARALRVLDVGCGDGRFGAYLNASLANRIDYLGVDASPELLARAQQRGLGASFRFSETDLVVAPPSAALPAGPFDLIAVLGVLHHVPGQETRRQLLHELGTRVDGRGVLALTFWRLPDDPRFASRVRSFATHNETSPTPIDLEHLEPGDTLLSWGADDAPPRYCHFPSAEQTAELIAATGLRTLARFRSDGRAGRLNEYVLLER
jgi:tRNA (uracil-5-)-methyltransferase TRM9